MESAHLSLPRPDCNNTAEVPFLNSAHCNSISLRSVWCRRAMIPGEIFTSFAKFKGIVSVNDFGFPGRLQELLQALFRFLRSFLFYMGMIVSTVLPSFVPQQRIDDCVEIHPSLKTLWSAVVTSPKGSALGTTVLVRLLQEALVIFVLKQKTQFRSWVKMLCLPDTTFARGSEGNSWEELEASRFSGTFHQPIHALLLTEYLTNFLSLGFVVDAACKTHSSEGE